MEVTWWDYTITQCILVVVLHILNSGKREFTYKNRPVRSYFMQGIVDLDISSNKRPGAYLKLS